MSKQTTLFRMLRIGERVSFDKGRISLSLEDKSGRTARLKLTLAEDVVVDKPRVAANDEETQSRPVEVLRRSALADRPARTTPQQVADRTIDKS